MKQRKIFLAALMIVLGLCGWRALAQQAPSDDNPIAATDRRILAEVKDNNQVMANLEYLSDMIGPRLTGTDRLVQANRWTAEMFRKYGLSNVHLEAWTIARAWRRAPPAGASSAPPSTR